MTNFFNLDFHGTRFAVPKGNLLDLFEHHTELVAKTSYEVQSSVPLEIFEVFARSLVAGTKVSLTKENARAISLLAKEFWLEDLLSECSALQIASVPELIAALSERISKLECQISSQPLAIAELKESIVNHERQLESLDCRISGLDLNLRTDPKELKSPIAAPTPVPPVSPSKSHKTVEFPLKEAKSFEGIISYLTRKHGGNVHEMGIVTITAKSAEDDSPRCAVQNLVSNYEPGQWVCWDFGKMRVRPTHYTIKSYYLKSWVVESSLNGKTWTTIDRKTDTEDFKTSRWKTASFTVSNSAECRFIRLTQAGKSHYRDDQLVIRAFEVFGTFLE
jgi:uncharacterized coiled-coil protein SlyX